MSKPKTKSKTRPLKTRFYDWQCELRQRAMREDGGRPAPGMCPRVLSASGTPMQASLTVLLAEKEPQEATAFFRFQVMKSADPRESYEKALRFLQSGYYKKAGSFKDRLIAVVPEDALLARQSRCILEFTQGRHAITLPCKIKVLKESSAARTAALWHNRVFNPALPDSAWVLAFKPDWGAAGANF
ncbi:MAG: hypothetical protein AAF405_02475 [Pseudomonadota bacterium]